MNTNQPEITMSYHDKAATIFAVTLLAAILAFGSCAGAVHGQSYRMPRTSTTTEQRSTPTATPERRTIYTPRGYAVPDPETTRYRQRSYDVPQRPSRQTRNR